MSSSGTRIIALPEKRATNSEFLSVISFWHNLLYFSQTLSKYYVAECLLTVSERETATFSGMST